MNCYRIGTDGDRSWSIQKEGLAKDKETGKEIITWTSFKWFGTLEQAALELLEISARKRVNDCGSIVTAIKQAKEDVVWAVNNIGAQEARDEVKAACEEVG